MKKEYLSLSFKTVLCFVCVFVCLKIQLVDQFVRFFFLNYRYLCISFTFFHYFYPSTFFLFSVKPFTPVLVLLLQINSLFSTERQIRNYCLFQSFSFFFGLLFFNCFVSIKILVQFDRKKNLTEAMKNNNLLSEIIILFSKKLVKLSKNLFHLHKNLTHSLTHQIVKKIASIIIITFNAFYFLVLCYSLLSFVQLPYYSFLLLSLFLSYFVFIFNNLCFSFFSPLAFTSTFYFTCCFFLNFRTC